MTTETNINDRIANARIDLFNLADYKVRSMHYDGAWHLHEEGEGETLTRIFSGTKKEILAHLEGLIRGLRMKESAA